MSIPPFSSPRLSITAFATLILLASSGSVDAQSATFTTLYSFSGNLDGENPSAPLIQARDGNLYGSTSSGGPSDSLEGDGGGTIFRLEPGGIPGTFYAFNGYGDRTVDGALVQSSDGNFYGASFNGGTARLGTIFRLTSDGVLTDLHAFNGEDGSYPSGTLIQAGDGNFYGTTGEGGVNNDGTIYRITADGTLTTLHSFTSSDEYFNILSFQGRDGGLYGLTGQGGSSGDGTVFRLTLDGVLTDLHNFSGGDGKDPDALIQANDGNFYGTAASGGTTGNGTIFRLAADGTLTTLHNFDGTDGSAPADLLQASDGNFYGTTAGGTNGDGTIFQLAPDGKLTTLHSFTDAEVGSMHSSEPLSSLIEAPDGNFYGTTRNGSTNDDGTVFRLIVNTPAGAAQFTAPVYNVDENAGVAVIAVSRTGGSAGAVSVSYATADGTAVAGTDYTAASGTLAWADGDASIKTIPVAILEPGVSGNGMRMFTLSLTAPSGGVAIGPTELTSVAVLGNNSVPTVSLTVGGDGKAQFGVENGRLVCSRTGDTSAALTVDYKVKGAAKAGVDYKPLSGHLIIPAGATRAKIKIKPLDDPENTGRLKVKVVLLPSGDGTYEVGSPALAKIVVIGGE